ncbi:MAG: hypothetical protein LBP82_00165, partial [Candidatus Methanoplasma sp.]|nr:hypothetical protein [Candidatus Methanoplasma sp.]
MNEYDPLVELGLTHDKQLVCSCKGFLQLNNSSRDLCQWFIAKGDKFYDLISRYDDMVAYVLNRSDGRSGNTTRFIAPFLKAFGATDYTAMEHCERALNLTPEAKRVMGHMLHTLPTFVTTSSYEHNVMSICEKIDLPRALVDCTDLSFDDHPINRQEAKALREMARRITNLKMPGHEYELNVPIKLQNDEVEMIKTLDDVFTDKIKELYVSDMIRNIKTVGANEKAYFLIDLRKRTQIDFEGTAFIGGDITDIHA